MIHCGIGGYNPQGIFDLQKPLSPVKYWRSGLLCCGHKATILLANRAANQSTNPIYVFIQYTQYVSV